MNKLIELAKQAGGDSSHGYYFHTEYKLQKFAEAYHQMKLSEMKPVAWMNSANGVVINKTKKQFAAYANFNIALYPHEQG
jgi:hypothetical protein